MSNYDKVERQFWNLLEIRDEDMNEEDAIRLEHSIRLLDLDPQEAEKEIESDSELREILKLDQLNLLEESSDSEPLTEEEEEMFEEHETSVPPSTARMNKTETDIPETSANAEFRNKKRKSENMTFFPTGPKAGFGETKNVIGGFLDIECDDNRKQNIDKWAAEINLIIQTNKDVYDTPRNVMLLAEHKSLGIAKEFIKRTIWDTTGTPEDTFENILEGLYAMFLGLNYISDKQSELKKEQEEARKRLIKLQICDICELKKFNCDYEVNFHKLEQKEFPEFIKQYLTKIPIVGTKALEKFREAKAPMTHSLGYAIKLVNEELQLICKLTKQQKRLKKFNKRCCGIIGEKPTDYGCKPVYKKSSKKKYLKRYKFQKKKKSFKPGKYFRKKKDSQKDKSKFCPKGKKSCRCWLCNIEGHYANECPNRRNSSDKVKLLEFAEDNGFEPIEDKFDDYIKVYELIEEPPDDSTESDDSSTDSD